VTPDPVQRAYAQAELSQQDAADEPGGGRTRRLPARITSAQQQLRQYREKLERHRHAGFLLQSARRFKQIEGKHLALVICMNLFVAVIPLLIIGYAFLEAFNPDHTVGALIVKNLHLTGSTAHVVRDTFASAQSGKSVALSISLISLLITGPDVSATAQVAYARAFSMPPLPGRPEVPARRRVAGLAAGRHRRRLDAARLGGQPPALVRAHHRGRAAGAGVRVLPAHPRLLLDRPFAWRDLVPGAAVCTVAGAIVHTVAVFFLRNWFGEYGNAYGAFGVGLALIAALGIIASFWAWIAAVMGVYWERKAGPAAVAAMEELSAHISAS
jgi:uncharacterized BrkB/YihY/UPF0761 family membrane protein